MVVHSGFDYGSDLSMVGLELEFELVEVEDFGIEELAWLLDDCLVVIGLDYPSN